MSIQDRTESPVGTPPRSTRGAPGCPAARYEELQASMHALEHFDNFDRHREEADFWFGDAAGHEFWFLTRMADIRDALQQPDLFSSSSVVPADPDPAYLWIPEMLDPPLHTKWRHLLGSWFAPGAVDRLRPRIEQRFSEILDDVIERGECDLVKDVALRFPNTIFMEIMGLPVEEAERFQYWEEEILHSNYNPERTIPAMIEVNAYFSDLITRRRKDPRDDLVSAAGQWEIDGEPVQDSDLLAMCLLLFMAGLDTVAAQFTYSIMHLARYPDDRRRLLAEPELWPSAIEEFLRYYAFVTPGRKVTRDVEFNGCPMKAGQMLFLPLSAATRDPAEFPDAEKVIIDRKANRHLAFGAGPHRCLGSHLARAELSIGLREWHRRIPHYRLRDDVPILEHGGQIGLDNLPIVWDV
ncbi:MAG TPA: cytochrome P450 [Pseudonocardia sp.]|jgi:cytochrome P450|nr:cytochrome P450 [Pseudonocardia sp.]